MKATARFLMLGIFLSMAAMALTGCSTVESQNLSARPWNAPTGWQYGLPMDINQGR